MAINPVTGGDPEFFILDQNDNPVPAWNFFDTQEAEAKKAKTSYTPKNFAFRDGYLVEINYAPEWCRGNQVNQAKAALIVARKRLPDGHKLTARATMNIGDPAEVHKGSPEDTQKFGCDPSWNAYSEVYSGPAVSPLEYPWRHAGGHMHMSYPSEKTYPEWLSPSLPEEKMRDNIGRFIKLCDLFIGIPLTYILKSDDQFMRRKLYGKAGEFRYTYRPDPNIGIYGLISKDAKVLDIEYRTPPSDMWNNQCLVGMAYGSMRYVYENFDALAAKYNDEWDRRIYMAIDTGKGLDEDILPTLPGFYWPKVLDKAQAEPAFHRFMIMNQPDAHVAWPEWADRVNLTDVRYSTKLAFPSFENGLSIE